MALLIIQDVFIINNSGNKHKNIQDNNHHPEISHAIFLCKKKIIFSIYPANIYLAPIRHEIL